VTDSEWEVAWCIRCLLKECKKSFWPQRASSAFGNQESLAKPINIRYFRFGVGSETPASRSRDLSRPRSLCGHHPKIPPDIHFFSIPLNALLLGSQAHQTKTKEKKNENSKAFNHAILGTSPKAESLEYLLIWIRMLLHGSIIHLTSSGLLFLNLLFSVGASNWGRPQFCLLDSASVVTVQSGYQYLLGCTL